MSSNIKYRSIKPSDLKEIKRLHELFFPVVYRDSFYTDLVHGIGLHGKSLKVIVVTDVVRQQDPILNHDASNITTKPSSSGNSKSNSSEFSIQLIGSSKRNRISPSHVATDITDTPCDDVSDEWEIIVGFVAAQILDVYDMDEVDLFNNMFFDGPSSACYILTIGVLPEYRKAGIGSNLLRIVQDFAVNRDGCGGVSTSLLVCQVCICISLPKCM